MIRPGPAAPPELAAAVEALGDTYARIDRRLARLSGGDAACEDDAANPRLAFHAPPALEAAIDRAAKARGLSRAAMIRALVAAGLEAL